MFFVFILLILLAVFLEGSIATLPLTLTCLLCLTIYKRKSVVFAIAFLAGLLLDLLRVNTIGMSSLFFIIFVFWIFLYQRKYEINSYPFVAVAGFLGSAIFLLVFGYANWFTGSLMSMGMALLLFSLIKKFSIHSI